LPATLVYGTALTCGLLAAIAVQIQLNRAGFDFVSLWQNLFPSGAMQLRTAGPWWAPAPAAVERRCLDRVRAGGYWPSRNGISPGRGSRNYRGELGGAGGCRPDGLVWRLFYRAALAVFNLQLHKK